ncbi:hypothetical protein RCH17_003376 [Arthrobacter sp. MP_M7]|nr:hypothetical protein [Arthrobacter sp. MP_M4]MEC5204547.1 hypothetical protein [Arthrobacter sp. MP_M7]
MVIPVMSYAAFMNTRGVLASVLCLLATASIAACSPNLSATPAASAVQSTYSPKQLPPRPTLRPATPDAEHIYTTISGQYRVNGTTLTRPEWDRLHDAICKDFAITAEGLLVPTQANGLDPKNQQSLADWGRAGAALDGCTNGVEMSSAAGFTWSLLLKQLLHQRDIDDIKRVGDFNQALIKWGQANYVAVNADLLDIPGTAGGNFGYCADGATTQSKGKQGACSWHNGLRR